MKTNADYESSILKLKNELILKEDQLRRLHDEHNKRVHAMEFVRAITDEAIAFTGRLTTLDKVDKARLMSSVNRTIKDAGKLNRYFIDRARGIEAVINGWPLPPESERPELDDISSDIGEGDESGSSEEEHSDDSGEAPDSVDDTGSAKE